MGEEFKMNPKIIENFIRESFILPDEIPKVLEIKYEDLERYTNKVGQAIYIAALNTIRKNNEENLHKINMN